jgi:small subunit ribosomal protein S17
MIRAKRKVRNGIVVSLSSEKTVTVSVEKREQHQTYKKIITRTKKYRAHNETLELHLGDLVEIMETRPLSKTKKWRVTNVLRKKESVE